MTIRDPETGWKEASIMVNGHPLSVAEALCVRVAVSTFRLQLGDPAFRKGVGTTLADNYDAHLQRVEQWLIRPGPPQTGTVSDPDAHPTADDVWAEYGKRADPRVKP